MTAANYGMIAAILAKANQEPQSKFTGFLNQLSQGDPMSSGHKFIRAFYPEVMNRVDNQRSFEILKKLLPGMDEKQLERFKQSDFSQEEADEILKKFGSGGGIDVLSQPKLEAEPGRLMGRSRAKRSR